MRCAPASQTSPAASLCLSFCQQLSTCAGSPLPALAHLTTLILLPHRMEMPLEGSTRPSAALCTGLHHSRAQHSKAPVKRGQRRGWRARRHAERWAAQRLWHSMRQGVSRTAGQQSQGRAERLPSSPPDGQVCRLHLPHRLGIKPDIRHQVVAVPAAASQGREGGGHRAVRLAVHAGQCNSSGGVRCHAWGTAHGGQRPEGTAPLAACGPHPGASLPVVLARLWDGLALHLLRQLLEHLLAAGGGVGGAGGGW